MASLYIYHFKVLVLSSINSVSSIVHTLKCRVLVLKRYIRMSIPMFVFSDIVNMEKQSC